MNLCFKIFSHDKKEENNQDAKKSKAIQKIKYRCILQCFLPIVVLKIHSDSISTISSMLNSSDHNLGQELLSRTPLLAKFRMFYPHYEIK